MEFLRAQIVHDAKNMGYFPSERTMHSYRGEHYEDHERVHRILSEFSASATIWLSETLAAYITGMHLVPLRFRAEEERAQKNMDPRFSGSVLHVHTRGDTSAHGEGFLKIFVNINPSKPRYWITPDNLERLLDKWHDDIRVPGERILGLIDDFRLYLSRRFSGKPSSNSAYHRLMPRIHFVGKTDDCLQNLDPRVLGFLLLGLLGLSFKI
jgi:hypothetical protein